MVGIVFDLLMIAFMGACAGFDTATRKGWGLLFDVCLLAFWIWQYRVDYRRWVNGAPERKRRREAKRLSLGRGF